MPIYEYECTTCGKAFEKLVRQSSPAPECPGCQSTDLRKKGLGLCRHNRFGFGVCRPAGPLRELRPS
jgi:putative FmdB family regulatory protein